MAQKSSYTDIVHLIIREATEPLSVNDVVEKLVEHDPENPPKNPRATVRSAFRSSGLIFSSGRSLYEWLPRSLKGTRLRHTLTARDFETRRLYWDTDLLIGQWPAAEEPESRRERPDLTWTTEAGQSITVSLDEEEDVFFSALDTEFWSWINEANLSVGDDLILTVLDPMAGGVSVVGEPRAQRNVKLIDERNRAVRRKAEEFLTTQRDGLAKPREIAASLLAQKAYQDSIPPLSLSNLLPREVEEAFGLATQTDSLEEAKPCSNIIPFPKSGSSGEHAPVSDGAEGQGSRELQIPLNTGYELPDNAAYSQSLELIHDAAKPSPALALHALGISPLCSPAYALLSQSSEFKKEALELAGQSVIAAERRIAQGVVESLISGEEFNLEEGVANYLEARSFLGRALFHAGNLDEAIEQAMHCFEIDPEDLEVREDLFVMLFDSDRHEIVIALLDSFPGASVTEELYHRALVALLEDPDSKEATKALRKAVSHNTHLARLFLGEDSKKAKKSSVEEADAYRKAYGFLWRREDYIFDLIEEMVVAKR